MFSEVCGWFYGRGLEEQEAFVTPQKDQAVWVRWVMYEQERTQVPEVSVLVGTGCLALRSAHLCCCRGFSASLRHFDGFDTN